MSSHPPPPPTQAADLATPAAPSLVTIQHHNPTNHTHTPAIPVIPPQAPPPSTTLPSTTAATPSLPTVPSQSSDDPPPQLLASTSLPIPSIHAHNHSTPNEYPPPTPEPTHHTLQLLLQAKQIAPATLYQTASSSPVHFLRNLHKIYRLAPWLSPPPPQSHDPATFFATISAWMATLSNHASPQVPNPTVTAATSIPPTPYSCIPAKRNHNQLNSQYTPPPLNTLQQASPTSNPSTALKPANHRADISHIASSFADYVDTKNLTKNYKLLLPSFPGQGQISPNLRGDTLLGPDILYGMLSHGKDLLTYIAHFFQLPGIQKKLTATPKYAEVEATTLARMLQISLLNQPCPITRVEQTPWMEVALRRLFVILRIEQSVAASSNITRDVAWDTWSHIMDHPTPPTISPHLRQARTSQPKSGISTTSIVSKNHQTQSSQICKGCHNNNVRFRLIPKHRIFPLPSSSTSANNHIPQLALSFASSLNALYYGSDLSSLPQSNLSLTQTRYINSIANRLQQLHPSPHSASLPAYLHDLDIFMHSIQSPVTTHESINTLFARGDFCQIIPDRLALPQSRPPPQQSQHLKWANLLPKHLATPLTSDFISSFVHPIINGIQKATTLPTPVLHLNKKLYTRLLERLQSAGMLYWRIENNKTRPLHKYADTLQMTLFAVSKSPNSERLISWPRICNMFCPSHPNLIFPTLLYLRRFELSVHKNQPSTLI